MIYMINYLRILMIASIPLLLLSCGGAFNQPTGPQSARSGELTEQTKILKNLPEPAAPIVVGVYNFKDQTGQYKAIENVSSFSTAVTQGATTILIKALEDSKWFKPIERENLGNLLNERNIIRSTREEYQAQSGKTSQRLDPLLFAGILLEGGVISYDTNILTGGVGVRYFGTGGSTKYRQDRITVYLRAISTSTGEVLKTVNVSKTILSQALDAGVFKYVNFQELLEVEMGFTKNEPTQLAVQAAIEKAVKMLIIEGIQDQLWSTAEGQEKNKEIVDQYVLETNQEESTELYEREYLDHDYKSVINFNFGLSLMDGDYNTSVLDFKGGIYYKYRVLPELSLGLDSQIFKLNSTPAIDDWWLSESFVVEYNILPHDKLSPYLFGGPGVMIYLEDDEPLYFIHSNLYFIMKFGAGLEYNVSERISFNLNAEWDVSFTDEIDTQVQGRRNDYFYNFALGLNYRFGLKKTNNYKNYKPTDNDTK